MSDSVVYESDRFRVTEPGYAIEVRNHETGQSAGFSQERGDVIFNDIASFKVVYAPEPDSDATEIAELEADRVRATDDYLADLFR